MRSQKIFIAAAFVAFASSAACAEDGKYSTQLVQILTATAQGRCSPELMGDGLLAACKTQLPALSAGLAQLGKIETVTFTDSQTTPRGPVETYKIKYAAGQTMTWVIGPSENGKFEALYSTGD